MCYQRVHVISSIKPCCWEQSDIGDATDVCTLPKFPAAILFVVILNQLHKTIRIRWPAPSKITVQLDLNFKNARVCNCTRTTRAQKYSLRASVRT